MTCELSLTCVTWRCSHSPLSAIECGGGLTYLPCGTGESRQCGGPADQADQADQARQLEEELDPLPEFCVEGCYCPAGTAMYEDQCVPASDCPCYYNNKPFSHGAQIKQDCNLW